MIENRPKYLRNIDYYDSIPAGIDIEIDLSFLPRIFEYDLRQLVGLQPLTKSRIEYIKQANTIPKIRANPTKKEFEYFERNNLKEWQLISIVITLFNFRKSANTLTGMPYSVSLFPSTKRGEIDYYNIELIKKIDVEKNLEGDWIYSDFNPFLGWHSGLFGQYSFLSGKTGIKNYSDSVGFVWGQYLLADNFDIKEILLPEDQAAPKNINKKFKRYRSKLFFKKFKDSKPRKIWGCESPIELFMLQGLVKNNYKPEIQTLIFKDGSIFPNYHKMIEDHEWKSQNKLITNTDFYFPREKVAIFCDGSEYHDSEKGKEKDRKIDKSLENIGIASLRYSGKQITEDLENVITEVINVLNKTKKYNR